ncbi:conserved Plasmodium protein, unknown function [Babesia microti strain RI]|uniref:Uncharacterized protein n=1 Tax=Babesia microti (strain RI) TaxID=1133968 RepID=A0A1N6LX45_BABMR|nr:conserved Plasmodium protein, unknown function [Babesia microti strain RI]SIO73448.1 conserved Plasmodium protein, unknown function [Babesia microti strain RI]|eukprot:XP_012647690.2 conserved Plasmodium protein, unknown function [Babesia microti strain RI]
MLNCGSSVLQKSVLPRIDFFKCKLNTQLCHLRCTFSTFTTATLTKRIITPEFLATQSHKGDTVIYVSDNNAIFSEPEIKSRYCTTNTKLLFTNIKNVDQRVVSRYEISTLPAIFQLKNGVVLCATDAYTESDVIQKNDKLAQHVETLKLRIHNINSDLEVILAELVGLIRDYGVLFNTRIELVQVSASAAIAFSDIPSRTFDQLNALLNSGNPVSLNNEIDLLVDSLFYGDNIAQRLSKITMPDTSNYSEPQYKARIYRAISSRYFREGSNKMALEYAYKSLQLDIEYQNSMINCENVMKGDPYNIDIYSDSVATIFIKHLIMAIGNSSEVLDIRSKIEFMFRDTRYVPLKNKPKSHPPGGPPMKGRGYRAKWIWHGLDYRPRKYKPRNIYKYHDEWRTIHDEPVINY